MKFNWLFDLAPAWLSRGPPRSGVPTHDEAYESICSRSFVSSGVPLPGTLREDAGYVPGREVSADGWRSSKEFEDSARLLEELNGNASLYNAVCRDAADDGHLKSSCELGDAFTTGCELHSTRTNRAA